MHIIWYPRSRHTGVRAAAGSEESKWEEVEARASKRGIQFMKYANLQRARARPPVVYCMILHNWVCLRAGEISRGLCWLTSHHLPRQPALTTRTLFARAYHRRVRRFCLHSKLGLPRACPSVLFSSPFPAADFICTRLPKMRLRATLRTGTISDLAEHVCERKKISFGIDDEPNFRKLFMVKIS